MLDPPFINSVSLIPLPTLTYQYTLLYPPLLFRFPYFSLFGSLLCSSFSQTHWRTMFFFLFLVTLPHPFPHIYLLFFLSRLAFSIQIAISTLSVHSLPLCLPLLTPSCHYFLLFYRKLFRLIFSSLFLPPHSRSSRSTPPSSSSTPHPPPPPSPFVLSYSFFPHSSYPNYLILLQGPSTITEFYVTIKRRKKNVCHVKST